MAFTSLSALQSSVALGFSVGSVSDVPGRGQCGRVWGHSPPLGGGLCATYCEDIRTTGLSSLLQAVCPGCPEGRQAVPDGGGWPDRGKRCPLWWLALVLVLKVLSPVQLRANHMWEKGPLAHPRACLVLTSPCCIIGPDLAQKWGNSDFAKSELGMNNPVLLCGCASSAC